LLVVTDKNGKWQEQSGNSASLVSFSEILVTYYSIHRDHAVAIYASYVIKVD
jgi:hypothetical protein